MILYSPSESKKPELLEAAQEYTALGWQLVAIPAETKGPVMADWQLKGAPLDHWQKNALRWLVDSCWVLGTGFVDLEGMPSSSQRLRSA